jgi:hypothetical protein
MSFLRRSRSTFFQQKMALDLVTDPNQHLIHDGSVDSRVAILGILPRAKCDIENIGTPVS